MKHLQQTPMGCAREAFGMDIPDRCCSGNNLESGHVCIASYQLPKNLKVPHINNLFSYICKGEPVISFQSFGSEHIVKHWRILIV